MPKRLGVVAFSITDAPFTDASGEMILFADEDEARWTLRQNGFVSVATWRFIPVNRLYAGGVRAYNAYKSELDEETARAHGEHQ